MTVQADLLIEIEAFLAARRGQPDGMAETTFGRLAVNDGKFVRRLRDGCNMTLATIDRVRQFIGVQQSTPAPHPPANDATKNDAAKPAPKRSRTPAPTPQPKPKRSTRSAAAAAAEPPAEKAA
jgi:hypothetical protein